MKKIMTRLLSLVLLGTFIPSFVLADNWDLDKGSITVSATVESQTVSQAGGSPTVDSNPVITSSSGTTGNTWRKHKWPGYYWTRSGQEGADHAFSYHP